MGFFSNFFESPYVKQHRQAAIGAEQLRLAAARAIDIEFKLLAKQMHIGGLLHKQAFERGFKESGLHEIAGDYVSAFVEPDAMVDRYVDGTNGALALIGRKKASAESVADLIEVANLELELRDIYVELKPKVTELVMSLARLNQRSAAILNPR